MHRVFPFALLALLLVPPVAYSANPHFTFCTITTTANGGLLVSGQVAGLGNQKKDNTSLTLEATTTAQCQDLTTTPPTVLGSVGVTDTQTYPPKNGNRVFAFPVDTPFVLPCPPPAEIVFVGTQVCDVTHPEAGCCPAPELPEPDDE
jgi:hypothetical protein